MEKIKWRTGFEDVHDQFITRSGNGMREPVYEFIAKYGRRDGILKLKVDKDGAVVTRNKYQEIQDAGVGCEIQKLLSSNPELLTDVGRGNEYGDSYVDFNDRGGDLTKFTDNEWDDYFNDANRLKAKYGSLNSIKQKVNDLETKRLELLKQIELEQKKILDEKNKKHDEVK